MTYPTKFSNKIGTRPMTRVSRGPTVKPPMMGAPVPPKPNQDGTHGYLKAHANAFPAGFISQGSAMPGNARAVQGTVGFDVKKGRSGD